MASYGCSYGRHAWKQLDNSSAPALFVAKNLGEKEDQRKVGVKEFLSIQCLMF
jgi:hypothetical protein